MSVEIDVEGYAAEQRFKELRRIPPEHLRADRKKQKQERLAILAKIDEYENQLCDKCKDKPNSYKCNCPASKAIQELGKQLGFEGEKVGRKRERPDEEFVPVVWKSLKLKDYESMKAKDMTDKDIWKKIGWNSQKLNDWKRENGLSKTYKKKKRGRPEKEPSSEIKGLTVKAYVAYKADSRSDAWISNKYDIPTSTLTRWKRANGVSASTRPQQAVQQPKGEKMMNDVVKKKEVSQVGYKEKYEELKLKYDSSKADVKFLKGEMRVGAERWESTLNERDAKIKELEAQLASNSSSDDLQNEIYSLTAENNRLKNYERDYRNLEVDYLNERTENERLRTMLDRLKHTAQINVWLMEQHVGFHKQLDEVMG